MTKGPKKVKLFFEFAKTFFNEGEEVEIIESNSKKSELVSDSIYSEKFIQKIKKAEENIKNGNTTTLNNNDVWSSLGLK